MKSNLAKIMDWVFISEGGYAERDSEPGGAVNMGISFLTYQGWRKKKHLPEPTFEDLKNMKRAEAEEIYFENFFRPINFDTQQSGVDYAYIDFAVNSGVGGSTRAIQRELKFPVTGKVDAKFMWALKSRNPIVLIDAICDARLKLSMKSKNWERFKDNWTRRVDKVRQRAKQMVEE